VKLLGSPGIVFVTFSIHTNFGSWACSTYAGEERCIQGGGET